MCTRRSWGLGMVGSLILATGAAAVDLDYKIVETNAVSGDFNWTVELYVVLQAGERLDAVAGDGTNLKTLTTDGVFYQNGFGGPTSVSINPALYPSFPSLMYDSWVTVGAYDQTGDPFANNALLDIGIDWTDFEDNGGDVSTNNGTWFVTPDEEQGGAVTFLNNACEEKLGVLIARLTVFGEGTSVSLAALFQGKDAGGATWQDTGSISVAYAAIVDCNANGVPDDCDISNGTSNDDNGNGIPDECEFPDCNGNGVDDNDDIANGTSLDCNGNGTPDECETGNDCNGNGNPDDCDIADGTSEDCNANGTPDECETFGDCNGNGVPDECENLQDWDGNGVPDACEGLVAYNTTQGMGYGDLGSAITDSDDGDIVWVDGVYADGLAEVDFHGRAIELEAFGNLSSFTAEVQMAGGASFKVGDYTDMAGLRSGTSGTASMASDLNIQSDNVVVYRDASLNLDAGDHIGLGAMQLRRDSELSLDAPTCTLGGPTDCADGSTIYATMDVSQQGSMTGSFDMFGSMTNEGQLWATDDILITDVLTNNANVTIYRGTLYVLGELINNGAIFGEVDQGPGVRGTTGDGPQPGDGIHVAGNYTLGTSGSLILDNSVWQLSVGGNMDVLLADAASFHMRDATLAMSGHGDSQSLECVSADIGSVEEGLEQGVPGNMPIGTLRIESGSTVDLVDDRNNDGDEGLSEVIYTDMLVVEAGATLRTNGYIIYVTDSDIQGTVEGLGDIIIINPPTPGDANGDGVVNIQDILVIIADWGTCTENCAGDVNADGDVNILDILLVIANWTF